MYYCLNCVEMCNDLIYIQVFCSSILFIFMLQIEVFKLLHKSDYSSKKISKLNLVFI